MTPLAKTGIISSSALALGVATFAILLALEFAVPTLTASFAVCFALLPVPFIAMTAAVGAHVAEERRIWAVLALVWAAMYGLPCMICYFTQLAVVRTNPLGLSSEVLRALEFIPGSFTFSIDMLGYGFMALSTLFLGLALRGVAEARWLRVFALIHGAWFLPSWIFPVAVRMAPPVESSGPGYNLGLIFWCATFIPVPLFALRFFRRA